MMPKKFFEKKGDEVVKTEITPCCCCEYYSWQEFEEDANRIAGLLQGCDFNGVFGPPRGGLTLAVKLSHLLGIPFLKKPIGKKTLIVDDIMDGGKTLQPYIGKGFIVTLFYKMGCPYFPTYYQRKKKDKYIIFPWEKQQCAKNNVKYPRN